MLSGMHTLASSGLKPDDIWAEQDQLAKEEKSHLQRDTLKVLKMSLRKKEVTDKIACKLYICWYSINIAYMSE